MFGFLKSKSHGVYWRNAEGKIECPDSSCPMEICSNSCPIYQVSRAAKYIMAQQSKKALSIFKTVVKVAPDYYEAWNNMAAIYACDGCYSEAYNCYQKAHDIDKKKIPPLLGLALTSRDLGRYQECLKWCDVYDSVCSDHRLDDARRTAQSRLSMQSDGIGSTAGTRRKAGYYALALQLLKKAQHSGYMAPVVGFPHIPELVIQAMPVAQKVFYAANYEIGSDDFMKLTAVAAAWSAYAGMGAVFLWNKDWPDLQRTGIFEALTMPRGFEYMNEYVTDLIGIGFGSRESDTLVKNLSSLSMDALLEALGRNKVGEKSDVPNAYIEIFAAMFIWGTVYEMQRLGMR